MGSGKNFLYEMALVTVVFGLFATWIISQNSKNGENYSVCEEKCKPNVVWNYHSDHCICDLTKVVK